LHDRLRFDLVTTVAKHVKMAVEDQDSCIGPLADGFQGEVVNRGGLEPEKVPSFLIE
jgi:hypothetical protein